MLFNKLFKSGVSSAGNTAANQSEALLPRIDMQKNYVDLN